MITNATIIHQSSNKVEAIIGSRTAFDNGKNPYLIVYFKRPRNERKNGTCHEYPIHNLHVGSDIMLTRHITIQVKSRKGVYITFDFLAA